MDPVGLDVRGLSRSGRDGLLRLAFARRGDRTVLTERRFRTPLQVLSPLTFADDPALGVMLLNPTGGVLGGDRLDAEIRLGEGAHVVVTTPSATRVYGAKADAAVQATLAQLAPGAVLEYVPDHVIPHPQARFEQTLAVDLSPGASLLLWDAWALGRVARDELWTFAALDGVIDVRSDGRPRYIDRFRLTPSSLALRSLAGADGYGYFASWLVVREDARDWPALVDGLIASLQGIPSVLGSASVLAQGGCVARLLARSAYDLVEAQQRLWWLSRKWLLDLPPLDLRKC